MRAKTTFWTLLTLALVAVLAWLGFKYCRDHCKWRDEGKSEPEPGEAPPAPGA